MATFTRSFALALAVLMATSIPSAALAEAGDPSPTAGKISSFYDVIFWAVVGVFAVIGSLIAVAAARARLPATDESSSGLEGLTSGRAEVVWAVAPAVFLALLAILAYRAFH